jgi:hypothetical protein
MVDSLFADVSEFQVPVDDSYPYQIFSFRSNDGTYIGGNGWPQLAGHTLVDGVATLGQTLGLSGFAPPSGPTQVPLPRDTDGRIRDEWIQMRGDQGNGWPQLGGRSLVDAVAAIGQKLNIAGFQPPAQ